MYSLTLKFPLNFVASESNAVALGVGIFFGFLAAIAIVVAIVVLYLVYKRRQVYYIFYLSNSCFITVFKSSPLLLFNFTLGMRTSIQYSVVIVSLAVK